MLQHHTLVAWQRADDLFVEIHRILVTDVQDADLVFTAFTYGIGGIGIVSVLTGLVKTARSVAFARARARVWAEGMPVEGTVSSIEPTLVTMYRDRQTMWIVRYTYRDSAGQSHEGTSEYMLPDKANAWNPGDTISIRYDRDKPHVSVWTSS